MNALALFLVFTSLVRAGVLTPTPENHNSKDDVAVKQGHTNTGDGLVIEFEKDDGNTKVSISPKDSHPPHDGVDTANLEEKLYGKMEEAKEKIKEAASTVLSQDGEETHQRLRPRELICDAYGKCKHKIASAMGKAKEVVVETAHEAAEKVYAMEEETKEAVGEAVGKVKDTVTDKAHQVKDAATEVSSKAKDKAVEKASEMKQGAEEGVYDVIDTTTKAKDKAFKKMEGAKEKAKEAQELVGSASDRAKKQGHKGLKGIFQRGGGVLGYIGLPVRMDSVAGVLHLLGFAAAYGMGLWVTFASNYVLAGSLPRYQFAMVQSKIYPVYFKAMAYSVGTALLGHLMSQRIKLSPLSMGMLLAAFNLMASLLMTLVNLLYLEPRATKVCQLCFVDV